MESSSSSGGGSKQRSLAQENSNLNVNEFLDDMTSKNTKKLLKSTVSMYNQTMESLNSKDGTNTYKLLDDTPLDELPQNICKFFMVCVKVDGSIFNASSLNTFYRMLVRHLKLRDEHAVDITMDVRFKKCAEVVKARALESAKAGKRPGVNASSSLSKQQLTQLMESDAMSKDNPRGLISLVHYILMTGFGCRAREECRAITNSDLVFGPESSIQGLPQYFTLSERITKTRRGSKNDKRDVVGRVYLDKAYPNLCPVRTLLHYQSKKTRKQLDDNYAFLLSVKQSAQKNPQMEVCWYTDHPMGVNYIGALFKNAVERAGLDIGDKKISGTTPRKNLCQSGAEGQVPSGFLSKMMAQKNLDSKLEYLSNTEETHKAASLVVSRGVQGQSGADFVEVFNDIKANDGGPDAEPEGKDEIVPPKSIDEQKDTNVEDPSNQSPTFQPPPPPSYYHSPPPPPSYYQPPPPPTSYYQPPPPPSYYYQSPPPPSYYYQSPPPPYYYQQYPFCQPYYGVPTPSNNNGPGFFPQQIPDYHQPQSNQGPGYHSPPPGMPCSRTIII